MNIENTQIKDVLDLLNLNLKETEIDGILIKKMATSNLLKQNRKEGDTGKQSHIAITADERDLFPIVSSLGYYSGDHSSKIYDIKLPITLLKSNLNHLEGNNLDFESDFIETDTICYCRKGTAGELQIQLSKLKEDEDSFKKFRSLIFEDDYLCIIKPEKEFKFYFLVLKKEAKKSLDDIFGYQEKEIKNYIFFKENNKKTTNLEFKHIVEEKEEKSKLFTEKEVLILALFISKYSKNALNYLCYESYNDAYKGISLKNTKYKTINSINNLRDQFDPYFDNKRSGWHQKPLVPKYKEIYDEFKDYSFEELKNITGSFFFNLSKTKVIDKPRNRIIYGAPGTGKSYQLDKETKDFSKLITQEKEQNESNILKPNYWIATCGENNHLWDDFIKDKIYAVGWDQLEDLKQYKSKKEIEEKIEEFGYPNKSGSNQWNIGHLLKEGDIIAIRKGIKGQLEGYGTVDGKYKYDSARDSFKHTISIRWEKTKNMKLSTYNKNFPIQSLVEMNSELKKSFKEECLSKDTSEEFETKSISTVSRVTFYDGYTHGQFVGIYKPVPSGEGVSYKYVAGPFIKQFIEAIRNPNDNCCLVIEEINRARADKVFGNIFQLLDRDSSGKSQYPIELSEDQLNYFTEKLESEYSEELKDIMINGLSIPSNLYIWATMNSADQGVYPLDSAFKRRWNFEHIGLDENEDKFKDGPKKLSIFYETIFDNDDYIHKGIEWNDFRKVINNKLLDEGIQEDRLIAPFFIKPNQFIREKDIDLDLEYLKDVYELEPRIYIDKVVMYLFEDVLRHKKKCILFNESYKSFSQLKKDYKEKIENKTEFSIFNDEIRDELRKFKIQDPEVVEKEAE